MKHADAVTFLRPLIAAAPNGTVWADVGASSGTFTHALAEIVGPAGHVHAVDRDAASMSTIERRANANHARITLHVADIRREASWRALSLDALDGLLIANTLHYVPYEEQRETLARLTGSVAADGAVGVIEYGNRAANRWVPYPIDIARLRDIVPDQWSQVTVLAEQPSAYGGTMYLAAITRGTAIQRG